MTNQRKRVRLTAGISVSLLTATCFTTGSAVAGSTSAADGGITRSATTKDSGYVNGVYTATGQYGGLPSSVTVHVTLVENVVTAVTVTPHATDPTSLDFQRRFAAAVPAVVVGKRIDEVKVGRLAGSSGTPVGFNAALRRIKEQARVRDPESGADQQRRTRPR
jgi:uncharacterized protein with FMN-binding domain